MILQAFLSDRRWRNLAVLAALSLVSLVLAVLALEWRAAEVAPKYPPREFFPGLAGKLGEVTRIHIESKQGGAFDVVFVPTKGWVLPGRGNFPASFEEVRSTLVGLAALETIEPKTARPDWYHYVDLDGPPKNGALIVLSDDRGHALASLIAGKSEDIGDPSGFVGLFVRRTGEQQSWLVKSPFEPRTTQADWLDKKVVDVDRSRIRETSVRPARGPAYTLSREGPSGAFVLATIPRGRELAYPGAADGAAAAVVGFAFDDIRPADNVDFAGASRSVTRTFDGLSVSVDVVKLGADYWARVFASARPGSLEAAKEANDINARANGWAYKLAPHKGAQFTATLESLLKPLGAKKQ